MKHLAAYLLLILGGNDSPTAKDIKNVLDSVGIEADDDRIKKLLGEVKGKDLNDLISQGSSKLASVPSGGGGGGGGGGDTAASGGAGGAGGAAAPTEEKKEEKEEEKEESDEDMGFGLFD